MEGVIEGEDAYITQSTGHSATFNPNVDECYRADSTFSTGHSAFSNSNTNGCSDAADFVLSTGHSAFFYPHANGCSNAADFVLSAGHSAFSYPNTIGCSNAADFVYSTGHSAFPNANECNYADFVPSAGHSAFSNGTDMDDFVASIKSFEISGKGTEVQAEIPGEGWGKGTELQAEIPGEGWAKGTELEAEIPGEGWDTTPERYLENLYLLGKAWVRKVQHVARMTLNTPGGPVWPTEIEPLALEFFDLLRKHVHWTYLPERDDFADEIDFVWRENPAWLPQEHTRFIPLWEYVTGMARTWGWNWHNEARKQGAPKEVWRKEERRPRSRL